MSDTTPTDAPVEMDERQHRLFNRIETLSTSIRKMKARIEENPDHPNVPVWQARLDEYLTSISNIHEFGVETLPEKPEGVAIEVPADIMELRRPSPSAKE